MGGWEVHHVLADLLLTQHREGRPVESAGSRVTAYRLGAERTQEVLGPPMPANHRWQPSTQGQDSMCRADAGRAGERPFAHWGGNRVEGSESHDWASVQAPSCLPLTSSSVPLKASFSLSFKTKKFLQSFIRRT